MKNVLAIVLQLVLFLVVFGAFSLFPPFHIQHVLSATPAGTRIFVADGLVLQRHGVTDPPKFPAATAMAASTPVQGQPASD